MKSCTKVFFWFICIVILVSCASDGTSTSDSDIVVTDLTALNEDSSGIGESPHNDGQSEFQGLCGPLTPDAHPCDTIVSNVNELQAALRNLSDDETVCLEDGTYSAGNFFIWNKNMTIRSKSGDRDAVIIDNEYRTSQSIFSVRAEHVTLADMTLKRAWWHGVHVAGGGHHVTLHNLRVIDVREQFVKVNPNGGEGNDDGTLSCSLFELTATGRAFIESHPTSDSLRCYTGGLDVLGADGWTVSGNTFRGIYCTNGYLPTHMVLFWVDSSDPLVEKNIIVNCARGIGFGLGTGSSHSGGTIKNNMIYDDPDLSGTFDVGIGLENAENVNVFNNTVYTGHYLNSIEYRFAGTMGTRITNNLTNKPIVPRNYGMADLKTNVTQTESSWFVDLESGDLHLASPVTGVVGQGTVIGEVADDIDGEVRNAISPDIGADEYY